VVVFTDGFPASSHEFTVPFYRELSGSLSEVDSGLRSLEPFSHGFSLLKEFAVRSENLLSNTELSQDFDHFNKSVESESCFLGFNYSLSSCMLSFYNV